MRDQNLLDEQMLSRILRGVSTRNYAGVINGFSDKPGISKSAASRSFKRASKKDLDTINGADLSGYGFVATLIDGTGVGETCLIQRCWTHKLRNIKDYITEVNLRQLFEIF